MIGILNSLICYLRNKNLLENHLSSCYMGWMLIYPLRQYYLTPAEPLLLTSITIRKTSCVKWHWHGREHRESSSCTKEVVAKESNLRVGEKIYVVLKAKPGNWQDPFMSHIGYCKLLKFISLTNLKETPYLWPWIVYEDAIQNKIIQPGLATRRSANGKLKYLLN